MSAVPDLLKIGAIPSNLAMSVETGILDPVVQNDKFIRFNMKRSGFLHSNSKLVLSLSARGDDDWRQTDAHAFLPASVGIGSVIERVRLLSGNTTIQEIQDWGDLHAYRSVFIAQENNKEREQYTTGRLTCLSSEFADDDRLEDFNQSDPSTPLTTGVAKRSDWKANEMTLDTGTEYYSHTFTTNSYGTARPDDTGDWMKRLQRFQYLDNEPVWQVSLQDLCPFLKQTQLPLFMFEEEIYLEITFSDPSRRQVVNKVISDNAGTNPEMKINPVESKLIIDYITYPQETMEAFANANQNLSFQYYDYELTKFSVDRAKANSSFIRNLGGDGKVVNKVIMALQRNDGAGASNTYLVEQLNGGYEARHPPEDATKSRERVITNLRYNTEYLYPIDVKNDAYHFNNVVQAEGQPPMVSRGMYSGQGSVGTYSAGLSGRQFEGREIQENLKVDYFYQTFKLNKMNRINQKGIELYQQMIDIDDKNHTLKVWLEVVKEARLVNGKLQSTYA